MAFPAALQAEFEELIKNYPDRKAGLIPALHRCQEDLGGWITPEIMEDCAEFFGLDPGEVFGVASFYPMFKLTPQGEHVIGVCHNLSCDLRGAQAVLARVIEKTGAKVGSRSADGKFTVEVLECQGACTNAPMFDLDGVYHEDLDEARVDEILDGLR